MRAADRKGSPSGRPRWHNAKSGTPTRFWRRLFFRPSDDLVSALTDPIHDRNLGGPDANRQPERDGATHGNWLTDDNVGLADFLRLPNEITGPCTGDFTQQIGPDDWASADSPGLWPALMPCNLIPIATGRHGDSLCLRIRDDGRWSGVVQWYHGGGDCLDFGQTIAEAILLDRHADRLDGFDIHHAIRADSVDSDIIDDVPRRNGVAVCDPWLDHAVADLAAEPLLAGHSDRSLSDALQERGIGIAAILAGRLAAVFRRPNKSVDVERAISWARCATQTAPSAAWGWESLGRLLERVDRIDEAIAAYSRGARCSSFSSQSVRMAAATPDRETAKYSLWRLQELSPKTVSEDDYLRRLRMPDLQARRAAVHRHWMDLAADFSDGTSEQLFSLHMSAWDIGLGNMEDYARVIACIEESARVGGMHRRANVAKVHLDALQHRYGVTASLGGPSAK